MIKGLAHILNVLCKKARDIRRFFPSQNRFKCVKMGFKSPPAAETRFQRMSEVKFPQPGKSNQMRYLGSPLEVFVSGKKSFRRYNGAPPTSRVKWDGPRSITLWGPSYGGCSDMPEASVLTKTCGQDSRSLIGGWRWFDLAHGDSEQS